jgi:hypothetical protein
MKRYEPLRNGVGCERSLHLNQKGNIKKSQIYERREPLIEIQLKEKDLMFWWQ